MTALMQYDDTDKRATRLEYWSAEHNTTLNAKAGRKILRQRRDEEAITDRRARHQGDGVPAAARFGQGETMAGHLATLRWSVGIEVRTCALLQDGGFGWEPQRMRACIVRRLS